MKYDPNYYFFQSCFYLVIPSADVSQFQTHHPCRQTEIKGCGAAGKQIQYMLRRQVMLNPEVF